MNKVLKPGPDRTVRPEKPRTVNFWGSFSLKNRSMSKNRNPCKPRSDHTVLRTVIRPVFTVSCFPMNLNRKKKKKTQKRRKGTMTTKQGWRHEATASSSVSSFFFFFFFFVRLPLSLFCWTLLCMWSDSYPVQYLGYCIRCNSSNL